MLADMNSMKQNGMIKVISIEELAPVPKDAIVL
jgi:hypothetical protein